jgi:surfactin synthase thioesterase subunit
VTALATAPWLVRLSAARDQTVRLVCLPHAGGGGSTFRPLAAALPPWIEVLGVRLPGRESRRREPPVSDFDTAVAAVLAEISARAPLPIALFGYCSGALLAHEIAVQLCAAVRPPVALFGCSSQAPHDYGRDRGVHQLPRAQLIDYLRGMNVMPDSILDDPSLFDLFEPAIRADFAMVETSLYRATDPLPMPVVAAGARGDSGVLFEDLLEWRRTGSGQFAVHLFSGGGHGFLTSVPDALAGVVVGSLNAHAPRAGAL